MPVITERDLRVVAFLNKFRIAKTSTLSELYYPSLLIAQKRLKVLYDNKMVRRSRDLITQEYLYYVKKPKQVRHSLMVVEFYCKLRKIARIELFEPEYIIGKVRTDALAGYVVNGIRRLSFLEIQISHNPVDMRKYERLYDSGSWERQLTVFPSILAVTDRQIPETDLLVVAIREDLTDLNKLKGDDQDGRKK